MIEKTILAEENRFDAVLTDGLPRLEAEIAKALEHAGRACCRATSAFRLYDTFGVPYDFIEDTAATQDVTVDRAGFERAMEGQRDKARARQRVRRRKKGDEFALGRRRSRSKAPAISSKATRRTRVTGVPVVALFDEQRQPVDALSAGQTRLRRAREDAVLPRGRRAGSDSGRIVNEASGASATVEGLARIRPGLPRAHRVRVDAGRAAAFATSSPRKSTPTCATRRAATTRRRTCSTRRCAQVLGTHVKQAGSLVAPDRLRFDFVHFQPVTRDELDRIERIVNEQICRNTPVHDRGALDARKRSRPARWRCSAKSTATRCASSACPGSAWSCAAARTSRATGDIGFFVDRRRERRRGGRAAHRGADRRRRGRVGAAPARRAGAASSTRCTSTRIRRSRRSSKLQSESKRLAREVTQLKTKLAMGGGAASDGDDTVEVAGVKLARRKVADLDKDALRGLADSLKAKIKSGVVVIASANDGKVQIVVAVTPDLTGRVKAGQIVKEIAPIVGGGGGGRPDFAEAGGKQPEKIDEMLAAAEGVIATLLAK